MNSIPNEIGSQIVSFLDFYDLLALRSTCSQLHKKLFSWAFPHLLQKKLVSQIDMNEFKFKQSHLSKFFIFISDYGWIFIKFQEAYDDNQTQFKIKCQFKKHLPISEAVQEIIESDPYSFSLFHKLSHEWDFHQDHFLGHYASFLRNHLKRDEKELLHPYKYQLYPMPRKSPEMIHHIQELLQIGLCFKTMVDGTVGMLPDLPLLDFEHEPPHWQTFVMVKQSQNYVELTGSDLTMTFQKRKQVQEYLKMIHRRWVELYSKFI
jgi:hypothetical protein